MKQPYIKAETIDDLLHEVIKTVNEYGKPVKSTSGENIELSGILLELSNPRARLSRTEMRGKLFSCLGELCWYLSASDDINFIKYYIQDYDKYADGWGAYGPRLFGRNGENQIENIIKLFKRKPSTRQAVIQLFDSSDIAEPRDDVPCTCTMQFLIREDSLQMITYMRSNDIYLGLPHDVFCFTMIQEIIASELKINLGVYKHVVGSLHLYERNKKSAKQYLNEGWQPTNIQMPEMPKGHPWLSIQSFLEAESKIRKSSPFDITNYNHLDTYWKDLILLLHAFRCFKHNDLEELEKIRDRLYSKTYTMFIDQKT